jgi:hypothetical protein
MVRALCLDYRQQPSMVIPLWTERNSNTGIFYKSTNPMLSAPPSQCQLNLITSQTPLPNTITLGVRALTYEVGSSQIKPQHYNYLSLGAVRVEPRALCMLGKPSTTELHLQSGLILKSLITTLMLRLFLLR